VRQNGRAEPATNGGDDLLGEALKLDERLLLGPEDERVEADFEREVAQRLDPSARAGPFSSPLVGPSAIRTGTSR
jgi:hypothetical protein